MDHLDNILVLGGSGFIGSAVVKKLSDEGCRIRMLVHRNRPAGQDSTVEQICGDITRFDWNNLNNDPPDAIIHLARISGGSSPGRYLASLRGQLANRRLIRWLESVEQPPMLIYASGSLVYGSRGTSPVDEDTPLNPASFQRSYMLAELPFLKALKKGRLPVSIVRPPWVYGPDSWFRQFYHDEMEKEGVVPQYGDGSNLMSLIHVNDCASQIIMLARERAAGIIANLVSGRAITHSEFCRLLSGLTGKKIREISSRDLKRKYGKTVHEALTFSADMRSKHTLIRNFQGEYDNDHSVGIRRVLDELALGGMGYTV